MDWVSLKEILDMTDIFYVSFLDFSVKILLFMLLDLILEKF